MKRTHTYLAQITLVLLVMVAFFVAIAVYVRSVVFRLAPGGDSWEHYQSGGLFVSASPSATSVRGAIYFASPCTGKGDIYQTSQETQDATRVTSGLTFEASPLVARDAGELFFSREIDGFRHIWSQDFTTGEQSQQTFGRYQDDPLQVSSDARYLLFSRGMTYEYSSGTIGSTKLLDRNSNHIWEVGVAAAMSPANPMVAYAKGDGPDNHAVWILDLKGQTSEPSKLEARGIPLQFSADGRYLLTSRLKATAAPYGEREIWLYDLETAKDKYLLDGYTALIFGKSNYKVIALQGEQQTLVLYDLQSMLQTPLFAGQGLRTVPRTTNDGQGVLLIEWSNSRMLAGKIWGMTSEDQGLRVISSIGCGK